MQQGARAGIAVFDEDYVAAGAEIMPDASSIFRNVNTIVKIKEHQKPGYSQLSSDQILFTYLHLAANSQQVARLMSSGCSAIAYKTIIVAQGSFPLLALMSEVVGRLASVEGASYPSAHKVGRGVLMAGVLGTAPANVL